METDWNNIIEQFDKISTMTDSAIDAYLHSLDENQQAMLSQLLAAKRALNYQSHSDDPHATDKAWNAFAAKHIPYHKRHNYALLHRLAAAACIVILISGIAIAANIFGWWSWHTAHETNAPQTQDPVTTAIETGYDIIKPDSVATTDVSTVEIYDNVPLKALLHAMARHYNATLQIDSPQTASLRLHFEWDKSLTLERNLALLNNFDNVDITYSNGIITLQ